MDLDTVIYIVITIVIFIISLMGQNKKPKQLSEEKETEEQNYSLNDFEKILLRKEEFAQAQNNRENQAAQDIYEEPKQEEYAYNNEIETDNFQSEKKEIEEKQEVKDENKKHEDVEQDEEQNDGFDINSAIIYSSILERKKFRH